MAEDDAEADRLLQDSISLARETGRPQMEARALEYVGTLYFVRAIAGGGPQGEAWRRVQAAYEEALGAYRRIGSRLGEAIILTHQAICAHAEGRYAEARSLHKGGRALFRRLGAQWWALLSLRRLGDVALTSSAPQEAQAYYQAYLDESQARGLPIEVRYALCGLGDVALTEGKAHEAARFYQRAVEGAMESWKLDGTERIMLSVAKLSMDRGERARAAELLAFAYHIVAMHAPWCWGEVGLAGGRELEQALQEALSPEVYAAAQERGRARDIKGTLRELLAELEADLPTETDEPQDRETGLGQ
jgi:tetratricopeptide (TPR) repeat protein